MLMGFAMDGSLIEIFVVAVSKIEYQATHVCGLGFRVICVGNQ